MAGLNRRRLNGAIQILCGLHVVALAIVEDAQVGERLVGFGVVRVVSCTSQWGNGFGGAAGIKQQFAHRILYGG